MSTTFSLLHKINVIRLLTFKQQLMNVANLYSNLGITNGIWNKNISLRLLFLIGTEFKQNNEDGTNNFTAKVKRKVVCNFEYLWVKINFNSTEILRKRSNFWVQLKHYFSLNFLLTKFMGTRNSPFIPPS